MEFLCMYMFYGLAILKRAKLGVLRGNMYTTATTFQEFSLKLSP